MHENTPIPASNVTTAEWQEIAHDLAGALLDMKHPDIKVVRAAANNTLITVVYLDLRLADASRLRGIRRDLSIGNFADEYPGSIEGLLTEFVGDELMDSGSDYPSRPNCIHWRRSTIYLRGPETLSDFDKDLNS